MAVLYPRQVAAEQAGTLLDVSLRHTFLQPVVSNGLADVDLGEHGRMRRSNQSGNFWQVEISAMTKVVQLVSGPGTELALLRHCASNELPAEPAYFFKFSARKATVRFQASAASSAR